MPSASPTASPYSAPERDAEVEHEGAVAQAEDGHIGREPGPEQVARVSLALGVGDDVDAVGLDLQRFQAQAEHLRLAG
jgi:hypothetical protein